MKRRLAALLGAAALTFAVFGVALAATGASDQGVTPTWHSGNITITGNGSPDQANCDADDALATGDSSGSGETVNGVTVTWTYDATTKAFGFTATDGLVSIAYVKGGNAYNEYDYTGFTDGGVDHDGNMFAPDNGSGGPAGLSHAVFCTTGGPGGGGGGETDQPTQPSTDTSISSTGNSGPTDSAWLLVVALGVLLASIVVLTPARAKSRR